LSRVLKEGFIIDESLKEGFIPYCGVVVESLKEGFISYCGVVESLK